MASCISKHPKIKFALKTTHDIYAFIQQNECKKYKSIEYKNLYFVKFILIKLLTGHKAVIM